MTLRCVRSGLTPFELQCEVDGSFCLNQEFESGFLRRIQYRNHSTPSRLRVNILNSFWASSTSHSRQAWKSVRAKSRPNREAVRVRDALTQLSASVYTQIGA